MMRKVLAFLTRDWLVMSSYRTSLLVMVGHLLFTIASFFFIGKLIDPATPAALAPYGGAYFPFVVLGLVTSRYLSVGLSDLSGRLRDEQLQGTLEAILTTPASLSSLVVGSMVWGWCWTTVEVGVCLWASVALFGLPLGAMNVPATLVLLILSVAALSSVGVVAACGVLLFKEFDPVNWILGGVMRLAGGVYFPIALLPGWLGAVAKCLPLTYALEGLRQAVLMGRPLNELGGTCLVLGVFAVVGWGLALAAFSWTLGRLKVTGALSFR